MKKGLEQLTGEHMENQQMEEDTEDFNGKLKCLFLIPFFILANLVILLSYRLTVTLSGLAEVPGNP